MILYREWGKNIYGNQNCTKHKTYMTKCIKMKGEGYSFLLTKYFKNIITHILMVYILK